MPKATPRVKRTLSLDPQVDQIIRMTESSILLHEGRGNYSEVVNRIVLGFFIRAVKARTPDEEISRRIREITQGKKISATELDDFRIFIERSYRRIETTNGGSQQDPV